MPEETKYPSKLSVCEDAQKLFAWKEKNKGFEISRPDGPPEWFGRHDEMIVRRTGLMMEFACSRLGYTKAEAAEFSRNYRNRPNKNRVWYAFIPGRIRKKK